MFDLLKLACTTANKAGCQFADARYLSIRKQRVVSRDHALSSCSDGDDRGFGVRVLYQGAWGFASSPTYTADRDRESRRPGNAHCAGLGNGLARGWGEMGAGTRTHARL